MNELQQLLLRIKQLEDRNIVSAEFDIAFIKKALSYAIINPKAKGSSKLEVDGGNFSTNSKG